jgi:hypothetical protein
MSEDNKFKKPEQYSEKTNQQLQEELAAVDMEMKQLDLELKREQVATNRAKRATQLELARSKRLSTLQFLANREANQKRCNHRKGGRGPDAVMRGIGDDAARCVVHHGLPDGSIMVLCQRCGKEWYPERKWNTEGGVLAPIPMTPGWEEAVQWNTDNSPSGSSRFMFEKVSN